MEKYGQRPSTIGNQRNSGSVSSEQQDDQQEIANNLENTNQDSENTLPVTEEDSDNFLSVLQDRAEDLADQAEELEEMFEHTVGSNDVVIPASNSVDTSADINQNYPPLMEDGFSQHDIIAALDYQEIRTSSCESDYSQASVENILIGSSSNGEPDS